MRKALAVTLSLALLAAACGDDDTLDSGASPPESSIATTEAVPTGSTTSGTTEPGGATESTLPPPPAAEPGSLAALAKGKVEDPLMGSGWHRLDWGDDAHTVLESRRSTTGDADYIDLLDLVAYETPPTVTGLAAADVLVKAFIAFPSMEVGPSALVVYTEGAEGWEASLVIADAAIEEALLETTDYAAAAPDGPALVEFTPTSLDTTISMVVGTIVVTDADLFELAYEGEIQCDFAAEPLTCLTLTDDGVLRPGDEGEAVEALQQDLDALGYLAGAVDGKYGPGTKAAVTGFQTDYLLTRDGKAGPETRELLVQVVGGLSGFLLASQHGIGSWGFGTGSEASYAGLVGILGAPDSTTGWYVDGCDGKDWFKARWSGFSAVFTDRNGTRQLDGWEVNDLSDLPAGLLIAGGIHKNTTWGSLDAMGADFFDDYLGQRWRMPARDYGNGRFVNPVTDPPAAGSAISSFGTGTGGFETC